MARQQRKTGKMKPYSLILMGMVSGLAGVLPAQAQDANVLPEMVVSANRIPTPAEQVGGSVTVITAEEIELRQYRTVSDALANQPGLHIAPLGGLGAQTSGFLRGANSNQTLVLIDGMVANDPSASNGAFDFAHLMATGVDRIEILRGASAGTYGSQAIGGVVNILTKRGKAGPAEGYVELEGGSFGTFGQRAGVSGGTAKWDAAAAITNIRSEGQSITSSRHIPSTVKGESDRYENTTATLKLGAAPTDNSDLLLTTRYVVARKDIDGGGEDPNDQNFYQGRFARLQGNAEFLDGFWTPTLGVTYSHQFRKRRNDVDPSSTGRQTTDNIGEMKKVDLRNDLKLHTTNTLSLGVEYQHDQQKDDQFSKFGTNAPTTGITDNTAVTQVVYLQDRAEFLDRIFITGDLRRDAVERFDPEYTWRISPVYLHRETDTRFKAAYGTGFRAPALFEMFGFNNGPFGTFRGNPNLVPEKSLSWEAGFEQGLWKSTVSFGALYFNSDVENLIVCTSTACRNTSVADIRGGEFFVRYAPDKTLALRADYSVTVAQNGANQTELQRRPRNKAGLTLDWLPDQDFTLSASLRYLGSFNDPSFSTGSNIRTDGFTTLDLSASYQLSPGLRAFARVENLFGYDYQVADGFEGRERAAYVGVNKKF